MSSRSATRDPAESSVSVDRDAALEQSLLSLGREIARLEAARARLIADAARRGLPQRRGFGSTTGWLMALSGDEHAICRSRVQTARALVHMPLVERALGDGDVSEWRARMLVRARDVDPEAFARDEELLLEHARCLAAREFTIALRYWRRLADADGHVRDHGQAFRARRLHASVTWAGMVRLDGDLDPESGATVLSALRSLTDPAQLDPGDARSPSQRRADALVEICRRHLDSSARPCVGGEKPHISLSVDVESLQGRISEPCELEPTGPIPPEVARRIACDATLTPLLTRHGEPIGSGRAGRTIPPALRRAVVARDRHCTHPGCSVPAAWCDVHHIVHWADGGLTVLANLTLLCRRHHRLAHEHDHPHPDPPGTESERRLPCGSTSPPSPIEPPQRE